MRAYVPVQGQGIYVEMSLLAAAPDLRRLDTMIWRWQRRQKQALQLPLLMDENYHANDLVQIKTHQGHNIQMVPAIIAQLWLEPVRSNNKYLSDYLFC